MTNSKLAVCWVCLLVSIYPECKGEIATASAFNIPSIWKSIYTQESNTETRMARFVGHLEGGLQIDIPEWWRNEGLTAFSERVPKLVLEFFQPLQHQCNHRDFNHGFA